MINKDNKKALVAVIIAAILGGSNGVFAKIALQQIPPFGFTLIRFLIAACLLLPFIINSKLSLQKKHLAKVILLSLLGTGNVLFFAFGIRLTTATIAGTLYAVVPLLTAIFSYIFLKHTIGIKKIIGIIVGFSGIVFITILPVIDKTTPFTGNLFGNLLLLMGAVLFALYSTLSKSLQKIYTPFQLTFFFALTTIITQIPLAFTELPTHPQWWIALSTNSLISLFYVASLGTIALYFIYQYAIKEGTPLIASLMLYLQPVAAFATAALILGERVTGGFIIGATITLFGVWLTTK